MSHKVIIFGTSTFAEVVTYYLDQSPEHEVVAFTGTSPEQKEFLGRPVVDFNQVQDEYPADQYEMFVAVGYRQMNQLRERFYNEAKEKNYKLLTYIHPSVTWWDNVEIGDNCFIFEDNTVQPFVKIGSNVILWSGNHIGHHSVIENHCFISSHVVVSGHCRVGNNSFVGVNSSFRDGIHIAEHNLIGAGAIMMKNTEPKQVFVPERTPVYSKSTDEINF